MRNKIKPITCLSIAAVAIFSLIFATLPARATVVNGVEQGDRVSMYKKIMYQAFEKCASDTGRYKASGVFAIAYSTIEASSLRGSDWFASNALENGFMHGGTEVGRLVEYDIAGVTEDGKIYCGENDNRLMKRFVDNASYLNLQDSHKEIICDGAKFRVFKNGDASLTDNCAGTFDMASGQFKGNGASSDTEISTSSSKNDYLDKLVAEKAFGNNVPAGSVYKFTDLERYYLYYDTFTKVCTAGEGSDDSNLTYNILVYNSATGELEKKYFSELRDVEQNDKILLALSEGKKSCAAIAKILGNANSKEVKAYMAYLGVTGGTEAEAPAAASTTENSCYQAAGKLGWLLCPVMEGMSNTLSTIWENYIYPSLTIDVQIIDTSSTTYEAWNAFRKITDVLLIIFVLIVIMSQLTGFGIDNYGIKKSLPRLIVAALLINLSFIICQLAVDVSNIVGSSIYEFLAGLGGSLNPPAALASSGSTGIGTGTAVTVLAGSVLAGGIFFLANGVLGTIIIILTALFSALISLLMIFLLLAVRESVVVIAVVIAPLAFLCYMLPNTKNLYDKWLKVFEGLIFIFPIAGLLFGGGSLASKIIINSATGATGFEAFFKVITAVVAEVAPLFLLPALLRGAFKATGALGATLNNLGTRLPRQARDASRRAATDNALYRTYQQNRQVGRANRRIQMYKRLTNGRIPGGPLGAAANAVFREDQNISAAATKRYQDLYKNYDKGAMINEFQDSLQHHDSQRVAASFRELMAKGGLEDALNILYQNPQLMADSRISADLNREMGASGDMFMREYTKWIAANPGGNFKQFVDSTSAGGLTDVLNQKSLVGLDKDHYKFMAKIAGSGGFKGLQDENLALGGEKLRSKDEANAYSTLLRNIVNNSGSTKAARNTKEAAIAQHVSVNGYGVGYETVLQALSVNDATAGTIDDKVKNRFSPQRTTLNTDPALASIRAQMSDDRRNRLL